MGQGKTTTCSNLLSQTAPLQHALRQEQLYLVLYLDQEHAGASKNQNVLYITESFGTLAVNDWPIYDGPDPSTAKLVARARGHHIQTNMHANHEADLNNWMISCSIVFMPNSSYAGSTLVVQGVMTQTAIGGEWTIVGGTGRFTLAQGAIYYDVVSRSQYGEIKELHIGVFYTTMDRSTLRAMFIDFNPSEVDDVVDNGTHLGTGGYGSVYKAEIRKTIVAVKINNYGSKQGKREFDQEVEILRSTRHENLVTLIGICSERLALIYEFLPNGSLLDRLNGESFSWEERIEAAMSICTALEFLHSAKPKPIAHGDLKPVNILFDAKNVCKLIDFGIARHLNYKSDTATPGHTTEFGSGTMCYIDPEFIRTKRLTPESDMYALGIILLQLVTGREPVEFCQQKREPVNLRYDVEEQNLSEQLVDSRLELDDRSKLDAVEMMRLGLQCSSDERKDRPDLASEVLPALESMKSRASR